MKRLFYFITPAIRYLLVWIIISCCSFQQPVDAQTVYVTKTGTKYHRGSCHYLKYSKFDITLKDAKKNGYTPCSVCKPSSAETNVPDSIAPVYSPPPKKSVATQCTGITKAGLRCKRMTTNPNGRCYQH